MSSEVLVSHLENAGWSDFGPGTFLKVDFDHIGKAKIARNNWFVLLKSVPVLDTAEIESWSDTYRDLAKRSLSGLFTSGKYFVLILLVDTVAPDAVQWLAEGNEIGFLETPDIITNGGGYTLLLIRDRQQVAMPKRVRLWDMLQATEFTKRTHQALVDYRDAPSE
jgi:hypothetical protein